VIEGVRGEVSFELEEVDITGDEELEARYRERIPVVLVDGAQAAPHMKIDVGALGCDFYALSSHQLYGPTGVGVLYGRQALLEAMPPYQGGGDMILSVTFEKTTYNELPYKFEAGTPNIAGVIGLGAAMDWFTALGHAAVAGYETELLEYGTRKLLEVPGVRLIGTAREKVEICFTRGHQELSTDDGGPQGLGELRHRVEKDNYVARSVDLVAPGKDQTLTGCGVVVIPGPESAVAPSAEKRLIEYFDGGGNVLLLINNSLGFRVKRNLNNGILETRN
jgi:hypothetical protein